jgi:hypothetical protein
MTGIVMKVSARNEEAKVKIDGSDENVIVANPDNDHELSFSAEDDDFFKKEIIDDYRKGRIGLHVFVGDRIEFEAIGDCLTLTKVILPKGDRRNIPPGT